MQKIDRVLPYQDTRFPFGTDCACRLRIYDLKDGKHVVLATELEPSPGASVTNTAERWATEACRQYHLNPFQTIFIENYDRRKTKIDPSFAPESFDFVSFTWDGDQAHDPVWRHAGRSAVEALIQDDLP